MLDVRTTASVAEQRWSLGARMGVFPQMLAESHDGSQPGEPLLHSYHRSSERAGIRL